MLFATTVGRHSEVNPGRSSQGDRSSPLSGVEMKEELLNSDPIAVHKPPPGESSPPVLPRRSPRAYVALLARHRAADTGVTTALLDGCSHMKITKRRKKINENKKRKNYKKKTKRKTKKSETRNKKKNK